MPMGQEAGVTSSARDCSISSSRSNGSRPSRSSLLAKVARGQPSTLVVLALVGDNRFDRGGIRPEISEIEQVPEVSDCRAVDRHVGAGRLYRVWQVVTAAVRERAQTAVALDKLQDRDMVVIGVIDEAFPGVGGCGNHRDPRAVAEKVHWLDIT